MTNLADLNAVRELRRNITTILAGQSLPIIGTTLVNLTADWLRQYNRPDLNETQLDQLRIALLMRFLKGVATKINLGVEVGQPNNDTICPPAKTPDRRSQCQNQ